MMTNHRWFRLVSILLVPLMLLAALLSPGVAFAADDSVGMVYVLSNSPAGNAVLAYHRAVDGMLTAAGAFATGGMGTGSGLGSQGAVALSQDHRWLFAVNAGSNDVSIFAVQNDSLLLVDRAASGGIFPISLTSYKDLLYVVNAGGSGGISGFRIGTDGHLSAIPGSSQPLSNLGAGAAPGPAQISFSPDGSALVVTEKASQRIDVYTVMSDGSASAPQVFASAGATPFGFAFGHNNVLVVSEAFGGAPDASAASSYTLNGGSLNVVSPSAATHQTAACWVVITNSGNFAYVANAGSGSVSGYQVSNDGHLTLLNADGRTGVTGMGSTPVDMAISHNSQFLYVLGAGSHMIHPFSINADGSLGALSGAAVPVGAVGIAAW